AVTVSRSATVMATWSKRRLRHTGALLCQSVRSGSRCCLFPTTSTLVSSETLLVPGIYDPAVTRRRSIRALDRRIYEIAGFIPTRSALVCQSLAIAAGSYATLLAVLGFPLTKNLPVM